jgi:Fe-S-cluster containining protein
MPPDDFNGVPPGSVGTLPLDAPITRAELERALRKVHLAIDTVRDEVIILAGQVVATGEELTRRLDGVEPYPAEPGTVAPPASGTVEEGIEKTTPAAIQAIRINDEKASSRVAIGDAEDKYRATAEGPDCLALLHLCKGKCCTLHFPLSSQDLDEGVIRWDYGRPYMIRQRVEDGYCVHSEPDQRCCTVYQHRPKPCRIYDCRNDQRIWADFDKRIVAEASPFARKETPSKEPTDFVELARMRQVTMAMESFSLSTNEAERMRHENKPEKK